MAGDVLKLLLGLQSSTIMLHHNIGRIYGADIPVVVVYWTVSRVWWMRVSDGL